MHESPLISIIIPTYRRPEMLSEAIEMLEAQLSEFNVEAIIVDNCPQASSKYLFKEKLQAEGSKLRYIHEPQSGVVYARNTGVAASQGAYILFLDDDEVPQPGWLAAFYQLAENQVTAAFGRILPRYETTPDETMKDLLDSLFSREYAISDGGDITSHYIALGTGNALFKKTSCFTDALPFDEDFNRRGGEDIWLIKGLVDKGETLIWAQHGLVEEIVPASRMRFDYLASRRYNQGQLRCIFLVKSDRFRDTIKVPLWMSIGLIQTMVHGTKMLISKFRGVPDVEVHRARMFGGLGKLTWWRAFFEQHYAGGDIL